MSHADHHDPTVPKGALVMAAALVAFALLLTASVRLGFVARDAVPDVARAEANVAAVEARSLRFLDQSDGAVLIADADTGAAVTRIEGEQEGGGFIRGVLRGMARERHLRGISAEPPFELTLWSDGSLSLSDAATGRSVELGAFGPDNRAIFAQLLEENAA